MHVKFYSAYSKDCELLLMEHIVVQLEISEICRFMQQKTDRLRARKNIHEGKIVRKIDSSIKRILTFVAVP